MEVEDGFVVHRSESFERTVDYLKALDAAVRARLAGASVGAVLAGGGGGGAPAVAAYADVCRGVDVHVRDWDLRSKLGVFLLHVPGVKVDHVERVLAAYPTFAALKAALDRHGAAEPLLARVLEPGHVRSAVAKRVAAFFTAPDYAPPPPALW